MEEAIAQHKPINKEQEEVLRSKLVVLALIVELNKLRQPLTEAIAEELSLSHFDLVPSIVLFTSETKNAL